MSLYADIEKNLGSFRLKVKIEAENETLALLGASGCGKSLSLKCIAGIERPDKGRIVVDGRTLFDSEKGIDLTPQKRRTGLMFQNYALFPNMTVLQNIQAGAKREKDPERRKSRISAVMDSFGLADLAGHLPYQLSGGQQQRVALARILVSEPDILLLDEPFSALDSHLRFRLERELHQVIQDFGKTVVLVSHDRDEVFRLSDKIAIIKDGRVDRFGLKDQVFRQPGTVNGAILTGCKNISRIEKIGEGRIKALDWGIELETNREPGEACSVGIRMHDIRPGDGSRNSFVCRVADVIENPFSYTVMLMPEQAEAASLIGWELDKELWHRVQAEKIAVRLPPEGLLLLNK